MSGKEKEEPEKPEPVAKGVMDKKRDRRDALLSPDLERKIALHEKEAAKKKEAK